MTEMKAFAASPDGDGVRYLPLLGFRTIRLPLLADIVAKVESCSGPTFWRKPEAQKGR
jgi:hypothetical protein